MHDSARSSCRAQCRRVSPTALLITVLLVAGTPVVSWAQAAEPQPAASADPPAGWMLGERQLPPPAATSKALRKAIEESPPPNVAQRRAFTTLGAPQIQMIEQMNGAVDLEQVQEQAGVSIEKDVIDGVPVFRVTPNRVTPEHADHVFYHLHGGGYVLGGGDAAVTEAAMFAGAVGVPAISVDYRMPPEHPFPAAVEDAVKVYRKVIEESPASAVVIGGTSAGGGLTLATVHRLQELGVDLPGAVWLGTPWADLTKTGDSLYTNEGVDRVLITYDGMLAAMARLYAGDESLQHPLISPIYGDFGGFPPTQLVTGTRDMFLSDTVRVHRALRGAGVEADLHVYEAMSHAEYLMVPDSTESREVFSEFGEFLARHLP